MKKIYLRKANENDIKDIFNWRNDEETRKVSFHSDFIPFDVHRDWFEKSLKDSNRFMYIAEDNKGNKIGIVRLDRRNDNVAEFDINLDPKMRGKKYGSLLIDKACQMFSEESYVNLLIARTKKNNLPSIKVFIKARFFNIFEYKDKKWGDVIVLGRINK